MGACRFRGRLCSPRRARGQWGVRVLPHLARRNNGEIRKQYKRRSKSKMLAMTITLLRGVVHATRIVAVVSAKSWASVVSSDDNDELLPSLGSISLARREC